MLPAGYEPAIPASERVQTRALDCATIANALDSCLIVDKPANIQLKMFYLILFFLSVCFGLYPGFFSGRGMAFDISAVIPHEGKYVSRGRCFNGVCEQVQNFDVTISPVLPPTHFIFA
jgi:hypothetical protein